MTIVRVMFKAAATVLTLAGGFGGPVHAGPFEDGLDAARRADYATVVRLWRPLAEQGDIRAQSNLALMYEAGRGVPQDYGAAASWYRKAAEQGDPLAQSNLAVMYAAGRGVPRGLRQRAHVVRIGSREGRQGCGKKSG